MKKLIAIFLSFFLFTILVGFTFFLDKIEYKEINLNSNIDGVAVLTGGKGRIKLGLELLEGNKDLKLIISGVDKKVSVNSFLPENFKKSRSIFFDKESETTIDNAIVIVDWIDRLNLKNISIITSYYHMPRSMLLLNKLAPKSIPKNRYHLINIQCLK